MKRRLYHKKNLNFFVFKPRLPLFPYKEIIIIIISKNCLAKRRATTKFTLLIPEEASRPMLLCVTLGSLPPPSLETIEKNG